MKLIQILKEIKLHTPGIPRTNEELLELMNSNLDKVAGFLDAKMEEKAEDSEEDNDDILYNYQVNEDTPYELDSRQNIYISINDGNFVFTLDPKTLLLDPVDEELLDIMNIFGFPVFYFLTAEIDY